MICFEDLFLKSNGGPVEYNGSTLQMVDRLSVSSVQRICIIFESVSSNWRQGVHLSTDGEFLVNGKVVKNAVLLWRDTAPNEVDITIKSKNNEVLVKNVWDTGDGATHSWHGGAAMIVEHSDACRRYRCNDGECDDDFDDLVFSIATID